MRSAAHMHNHRGLAPAVQRRRFFQETGSADVIDLRQRSVPDALGVPPRPTVAACALTSLDDAVEAYAWQLALTSAWDFGGLIAASNRALTSLRSRFSSAVLRAELGQATATPN